MRDAHEFDVCLSFAARDRAYVDRVAKELRKLGVTCFYDHHFRARLWGGELRSRLDETFRSSALCCVVFGSADYVASGWSRHELRSARTRASQQQQEYILLARFDDTEIPGIPSTHGHVDLSTMSPRRFARLVNAKVAQLRRDPVPVARAGPARDRRRRPTSAAGVALTIGAAVVALSGAVFAPAFRPSTDLAPVYLVDRSPIAESSWTIGMTTLDDTSYSRALITGACEDNGSIFVSYVVDPGHTRFRAVAGIPDDAPDNDALVTFVVRGDGRELHSEPLLAGDTLVADVPVEGVRLLELLVIYDETDWGNCDGVVLGTWADARLE